MTLPTITYGVGAQDDCGNASLYTVHDGGATSSHSIDSGTVLNIAVSAGGIGLFDYYEYDLPTNVPASTYSKGLFRYKTSSTGMKARVQLVFTDGNTEFVCGLLPSTTWAVQTWTVSAGNQSKTIDKIRLYACEGPGNVYYDFWTIYAGTQTFHNYDRLTVTPRIKKAVIPIPSSDTDMTQMLGRANAVITIEGPMRSGKSWGGSNLTYGEYFMQLLGERRFQWFTSDQGNFKVTPVPEGFSFTQDKASDYQLHYSIQLEEYDEGDANVFGSPAWFGK